MNSLNQGDILKVENVKFPVLIVSKNYFNQIGQAIVCPIIKSSSPDPLHIPIQTNDFSGIVLCEQINFLDLRLRGHKKISELSINDIKNITDAIQGIFDYYP